MKITLIKRKGNLIPWDGEARDKVDSFVDGAIYEVDIKNMDKRSLKQNSSIHLWCNKISDSLNREDISIEQTIKISTKWNMNLVKEMLFKSVVKSLYAKDSTTQLNKNEFELIIDTLIGAMASKGITIPDFPNREQLEQITKNKEVK